LARAVFRLVPSRVGYQPTLASEVAAFESRIASDERAQALAGLQARAAELAAATRCS
jgi:F0F1-type ATP synthase beta subunit